MYTVLIINFIYYKTMEFGGFNIFPKKEPEKPGTEGIEVSEIKPEEITMSGKENENMPPNWNEDKREAA